MPRLIVVDDSPTVCSIVRMVLEREGWEVHTQPDDPSIHGPALEELSGTEDEKQAAVLEKLKEVHPTVAQEKRALILFCSHIGGHKYAGNVIVRLFILPLLMRPSPLVLPFAVFSRRECSGADESAACRSTPRGACQCGMGG